MFDSTSKFNHEVGFKMVCFFMFQQRKFVFLNICRDRVFCKIKQSLMKDLPCVSPSDNTILFISTTDSRNVYAMSLMVQRESSWNGSQALALKTVRISFLKFKWKCSLSSWWLVLVVWKDAPSSFIFSSNWHTILSTCGSNFSHQMRADSPSGFKNPDAPP